jgi:hypothetical protein
MLALASCTSVVAAPISWNYWTSGVTGFMPVGNQNITVTYVSADYSDVVFGVPNWTPASTWADGTIISNAPTQFHNVRQILGGSPNVNTLLFSQPVVDPVIAIWSLGSSVQGPASFVFTGLNPQNIVGGPSSEYGGGALVLNGVTVSGIEGNGSIQFLGTYSSLSWTNPQYEDYYGFNVGVVSVVPEPSAMVLSPLCLAALLCRRPLAKCIGKWRDAA